jgi:hypothetical protein
MPLATPLTPSEGSSSDPRATNLGKKLRRLHIDELPNAVNVLRAEMSLFGGPRALIREDVERTFDVLNPSEQREWRASRSTARPSVFGLFQLEQHESNYTTDDLYRVRAMSDIRYAKEASFALDMSILLRSVHSGLQTSDRVSYGRGANFLGVVAKSMGVDVTPADLEYWRVLFKVARAFDDQTDIRYSTNVHDQFDKLSAGSPTCSIKKTEAKKFATMYNTLSPERRALIREVITTLPAYAAQKRTATSVMDLDAINQREARGFAAILSLDPIGSDSKQRVRMNEWLLSFAAAGYAADALTDLREDFAAKNVSIQPTPRNHLLLSRVALGRTVEGLRATPPAALGSVLRIAALNTMKRL